VLTLRKTAVGYRLFSEPVKELEALRQQHKTLEPTTVHQLGANFELAPNLLDSISPAQMELVLDIEPSANARFSVELSNPKGEVYRIGYDAKANQFFSDRTKAGDHSFSPDFAKQPSVAPRISKDKTVRMHLFFDAASAELFADGGATVMTEVFFPGVRFNKLRLVAEGGEVKVVKGEAWGLGRIW
jgi:fructan beta-fructosidase